MIKHNLKNIVDVLANTLRNNVDTDWKQTYNETINEASTRLNKITKLSDIGIPYSEAYEAYSSLIFDTFANSKEFMENMLDKTTLTIHFNHISDFINYDVDDIYFNDDNDGMYIIDTLNIYLGLETKQD
jgi:hypothetical protein